MICLDFREYFVWKISQALLSVRSLTYNEHMSQSYAIDFLLEPVFWFVDNFAQYLGKVSIISSLTRYIGSKILKWKRGDWSGWPVIEQIENRFAISPVLCLFLLPECPLDDYVDNILHVWNGHRTLMQIQNLQVYNVVL